jgi:hypothetical protein
MKGSALPSGRRQGRRTLFLAGFFVVLVCGLFYSYEALARVQPKPRKAAAHDRAPGRAPRGAGGGAAAGVSAGGWCPSYRGEYDPADVRAVLARNRVDVRAQSKLDAACTRMVYAEQNWAAGLGHRLNQWTAAFHAALAFNATFVHTEMNGGVGNHGNYDGWDEWMGLGVGELSLGDARALAKEKGYPDAQLPNFGGEYMHNEEAHRGERWGNALRECGRLWKTGTDKWFYDHSTTSKSAMALKFDDAMQVPGAGSAAIKERAYDPLAINVALHIRKGDQYPTKEGVFVGILREVILPGLDAQEGLKGPVAVHVFSEAKDFPALLALHGSRTPGGLALTVALHPDMAPRPSFWHLTQADFLLMSYSSFSWAAAQLALRPLTFSPRSSDDYRMCGDTSVCCDAIVGAERGVCHLDAHFRVAATARRIAAQQSCGLWDSSAPY